MISEGSCDTEDWSNAPEFFFKCLIIEYGPFKMGYTTSPPNMKLTPLYQDTHCRGET